MERHIERELYYELNNICTQVNKDGYASQENVLYNHAVKV